MVYYCAVIPNNLRAALVSSGSSQTGSSSGFLVTAMNVTSLSNSTGDVYLEISVPAYSVVGGLVTLVGPTTFTLGNPDNFGAGAFEFTINDSVQFALNRPTRISLTAKAVVTDMDTLSGILGGAYGNYRFAVKTQWTLQWIGVTWYRQLALAATYDLSRGSSTGGIAFSEASSPFPAFLQTPHLNSDISQLYPATSLVSLGSAGLPMVHFGNFSLVQSAASPATVIAVETTLALENPLTVQMNVSTVSFTIGSGSKPLVDVLIAPTAGVWQISNQPAAVGYASRVMTVPCTISFTLRNAGSSLLTSLLSLSSQLQTSPTLMGPFDVVSFPERGHVFGLTTAHLVVELPGDAVSAAVKSLMTTMAPLLLSSLAP
ncbi:hypothetical protein HDV03_001812 [Kappamyces sp. JEL0829]|nr:hypothetical protein HDV03_001812 [Kappamyces sp. JEL0829]